MSPFPKRRNSSFRLFGRTAKNCLSKSDEFPWFSSHDVHLWRSITSQNFSLRIRSSLQKVYLDPKRGESRKSQFWNFDTLEMGSSIPVPLLQHSFSAECYSCIAVFMQAIPLPDCVLCIGGFPHSRITCLNVSFSMNISVCCTLLQR